MRSKIISFRAPAPLYDAMMQLCRDNGYGELSNFMIAIALLSIQDSRRPNWIKHIANAKPKIQDFMIDRLLKWPQDKEGMVEAMRRMDINK